MAKTSRYASHFPLIHDQSPTHFWPQEDFSKALRADAPFTGGYFCCSTGESAPNPALRVAGVGLLELPLSEGGARLITTVASPVRAAEGQIANSVWEVGASYLGVGDAAWQDYLANTILQSVSDQLGFTQFTKSNVQIELSKLMLLGPGSECVHCVLKSLVDGH
jgi:hypothetical protein